MRRVIAVVLLLGGLMFVVGPSVSADHGYMQEVGANSAPVFDPKVACPPSNPCGPIQDPDAAPAPDYYSTAEKRIAAGLITALALFILSLYLAFVRALFRRWRAL